MIATDDLDGSHGAETVTFGLDGVSYEIDLGSRTGQGWPRHSLPPFIAAGRRVNHGTAVALVLAACRGPVAPQFGPGPGMRA